MGLGRSARPLRFLDAVPATAAASATVEGCQRRPLSADPAVQRRVEAFVLQRYPTARSLREIAEPTRTAHSRRSAISWMSPVPSDALPGAITVMTAPCLRPFCKAGMVGPP